MARVKHGKVTRRRHKAVLKAVKGHKFARSRRYRVANESLMHAMDYATRHRRLKKRQMRSLAVIRINALARVNGITYSKLISGLRLANIQLDRPRLADLAMSDPSVFSQVVKQAKGALTVSVA